MATGLTVAPSAWTRAIRKGEPSPVMQLWDRLDGIYGTKWRARFPDEAAVLNWRAEWGDALHDRAVTYGQVKKALQHLRERYTPDSWPPDLPEFLGICLEVPCYEEAFKEAQLQCGLIEEGLDRWSHNAIFWAAMDFGVYELRQAVWKESRRRWIRLLTNRLATPQMPPPKRLPKPEYKKGDPVVARKAIAQLREQLGMR